MLHGVKIRWAEHKKQRQVSAYEGQIEEGRIKKRTIGRLGRMDRTALQLSCSLLNSCLTLNP